MGVLKIFRLERAVGADPCGPPRKRIVRIAADGFSDHNGGTAPAHRDAPECVPPSSAPFTRRKWGRIGFSGALARGGSGNSGSRPTFPPPHPCASRRRSRRSVSGSRTTTGGATEIGGGIRFPEPPGEEAPARASRSSGGRLSRLLPASLPRRSCRGPPASRSRAPGSRATSRSRCGRFPPAAPNCRPLRT